MSEEKKLIRRLNIIAGQVTGISKMIEQQKNCKEIITQLKAVKSSFNSVSEEFIKRYLKECLQTADKLEDEKVEEALRLLSKF